MSASESQHPQRAETPMVTVTMNGEQVDVPANSSVLAASLAVDPISSPQVICGMGSCYACVVTCGGHERVRACITQVEEGESYEW